MNVQEFLEMPPWEWPSSAGRLFRKTLANKQASPADRLAAAALSGDLVVMNDSLAETVLAVIRDADEPEELRARSAIALGPVLEQCDIFEFDEPEEVPITEATFTKIRSALQTLYIDTGVAKEVRRRILEASVRAPAEWHHDAVAEAYASGDREWKLTAVFCMRWIEGFDPQILAELKNPDPEIRGEAVAAAGEAELETAWPHLRAILTSKRTPKALMLTAIEAAANVSPKESRKYLADLADSEDEEIREAVEEAISMSDGMAGLGLDDDDEDDDEDEEE